MGTYNSVNTWAWNCPSAGGGKNDLDYRIVWGDEGTLTIKKHSLIGISYSLKCWNSLDGWVEINREQNLDNPVEEYTFHSVFIFYSIARDNADTFGQGVILWKVN